MDTNQGPAAIFKHTAFGQILKAVLVSTVFFSALVHAAPIAVEKIFVSQFEAQPVGIYPRIEFVGDRTQIFSGPDETRTATVRIFDASGTLIADPSIDWVSGDGALLSVSPTVPGEAQLQSEGAWDGSLTYQAPVCQHPTQQHPFVFICNIQGANGVKRCLIPTKWSPTRALKSVPDVALA